MKTTGTTLRLPFVTAHPLPWVLAALNLRTPAPRLLARGRPLARAGLRCHRLAAHGQRA